MSIENIYVNVRIAYDSEDIAQVVYSALEPEINLEFTKSLCNINIRGNELLMRVRAHDISSVRATLNSYLRWMACAENVYNGVWVE